MLPKPANATPPTAAAATSTTKANAATSTTKANATQGIAEATKAAALAGAPHLRAQFRSAHPWIPRADSVLVDP